MAFFDRVMYIHNAHTVTHTDEWKHKNVNLIDSTFIAAIERMLFDNIAVVADRHSI